MCSKVWQRTAPSARYTACTVKVSRSSISFTTKLNQTQQKRSERRRRESKLPFADRAFDLQRLPQKAQLQASLLLEGSFIAGHENVLVFGMKASGKTVLLRAIGNELVRKGHRV